VPSQSTTPALTAKCMSTSAPTRTMAWRRSGTRIS
jgi:hypothetical protein